MKSLLFFSAVLAVAIFFWWYVIFESRELSTEEQQALDNASTECKYRWENFRVLRHATTVYSNSGTQSGFTVIYYEQVIGADRHRVIALYEGPQVSWESCQDKLGRQYANTVRLGTSDYPYAIVISEGTVTMLYTRDKRRARRLEDLPIIGTRKDAYYVEDLEAQDKPGRP